jgi:putative methionine-R-sulfoxide reductase with GAF domain
LLNGEPDPTANLANAAAVIYHTLPGLNWAGFYLLRDNELYQSALTLTCMRVGLVWRLRAKSIR